MTFLNRFTRGDLQLTRIEAFTDAVFAIIATLLVLELKVPILGRHPTVSELGGELHELLPKFLAWLLSFIILCQVLAQSPSSPEEARFYIVPPDG